MLTAINIGGDALKHTVDKCIVAESEDGSFIIICLQFLIFESTVTKYLLRSKVKISGVNNMKFPFLSF